MKYAEFFGEDPASPEAKGAFLARSCRFLGEECSKRFGNGLQSGACSLLNPRNPLPVICCPKRFYADNHALLDHVSAMAFGSDVPVVKKDRKMPDAGSFVLAFGQGYGHEIRVPYATEASRSLLSIDWILALVGADQELREFVALEVQTIDTTGNYQREYQRWAGQFDPNRVADDSISERGCGSNFNSENVNKRILPQLITKGNVLRRENLCSKGLFFACPQIVLDRIKRRVGDLQVYPMQTGAITFLGYSLERKAHERRYALALSERPTTTSDQLYLAFTSPRRLPPAGVYEEAVRKAPRERLG